MLTSSQPANALLTSRIQLVSPRGVVTLTCGTEKSYHLVIVKKLDQVLDCFKSVLLQLPQSLQTGHNLWFSWERVSYLNSISIGFVD